MERLTFPRGSRVYLDTAPIIYSVEEHESYWSVLQPLWAFLKNGEIEVVTSELSMLETLVVPLRNEDADLITAYETLLTASQVELIPINTSVLRTAAELRAKQNLKTPDAIHASTASLSNCDLLISNDEGFRRLTTIDVIILSDLIQGI